MKWIIKFSKCTYIQNKHNVFSLFSHTVCSDVTSAVEVRVNFKPVFQLQQLNKVLYFPSFVNFCIYNYFREIVHWSLTEEYIWNTVCKFPYINLGKKLKTQKSDRWFLPVFNRKYKQGNLPMLDLEELQTPMRTQKIAILAEKSESARKKCKLKNLQYIVAVK